MHESSEEAAVVCALLRRVVEDRDRSIRRPLAEYQAMYPGFEAIVAREFGRLADDASERRNGPPSVLDRLGDAVEPDVRLPAGLDGSRVGSDGERPTIGRYRDVGEIARGGMGSVHEVWDPDLRRRIAMKLLLDCSESPRPGSGDPRVLTRFLEEAQITSQLEHPSIVPVHELGIDDSGRVFFTMTLVRGRTFEEVIADVRAGQEDWPLARALGVLQRVCDAIGFAHSKGVVHRDLKPANIMVGPFGEVYVMDWGLARVVGGGDRADDRRDDPATGREPSDRIDSAGSESDLRTMDGDVVGTACYMPPEQARGEVRRVGPPADVYAIGAILYHLLTGRRPFTRSGETPDSGTVLERVRHGPPRSLQALAPDAPPELVAICEKAMARGIQDRYADVRELGADLRAFLEVRVVTAYEAGAFAELRKWVRRNRSQALAAAAAVVALAAGLVFSLVQAKRADTAAHRAETNFDLATDAMAELVRIGSEALANVPQVDAVRREMLQRALDFHLRFVEIRGGDFDVRERAARAWDRVADIRRQLGEVDASLQAYHRAIALLDELLGERPDRIDLVAQRAWTQNGLANLFMSRGEWDTALAWLGKSLPQLEQLVELAPDVAEYRVRAAHVHHNTGVVYGWQKRFEEALGEMEAELEIRRAIVERHPDSVEYRAHLATAVGGIAYPLRNLGRHEEAIARLEESTRMYDAVLEQAPDVRQYREHAALSWTQLGATHRMLHRFEDSHDALVVAIRIRRELVRDHPHVPEHQHGLGMSADNLARTLFQLEDYPGARDAAEEAIAAETVALERIPDEPQYRAYLGRQYSILFRTLSRVLDHRALAQRCAELRDLDTVDRAWACYTAGYYLGRSASIARHQDESLTDVERTALVDDYAERAVVALQDALDLGWTAWRLDSTVFVELRDRPDFLAVQAAVRALGSNQTDGK